MKSITKTTEYTSDKVKDFLSFIKKNIDTSNEMHDIGIDTELTQWIEKVLSDPIDVVIDNYNSSFNQLKKIMNMISVAFFKKHKDVIKRGFIVPKTHQLTYYIVLNNDNSENRDIFFEFIFQYERLGIQNELPISIIFLPERVVEKSGLDQEIILN